MLNDLPDTVENQKLEWKAITLKSYLSTPFQSPEFYDFFNSVSNQRASVYRVVEKGVIKAMCLVTFQKEKGLKGYFSRRAIIYGGPLILEDDSGALTKLLKVLYKELRRKVIYIETRNLNDYSAYESIFINQGWQYLPYVNVQIPLENKNSKELLAAMNYNRRREIGLSLKEGATYEEAALIQEVHSLYRILSDLYKARVKLPLPALDYFEKLFFSPIGKVFIVRHNNLIIGGAFCFFQDRNSICTIYYCGLRDYHKKIFPTHLAILAALEYGVKNKLKKLDLMGAGKAGETYGVRSYKTEFGGDLVEYGRFIKVCNPVLFKLGKAGLSVLKKMK